MNVKNGVDRIMKMNRKNLVASFRQGGGSMAQNARDYYKDGSRFIMHEWAIGGESETTVDEVPGEIKGWRKTA